ncbi:MAG TPA: hypothetical protein DIV39_06540 [Verrucomicrobiales bacterium]|nr:hypothetical protein [Verrucomicrobiales bacterium]
MSSSTSSFKCTEWKVLAVLAGTMLLLEIIARILAPSLDYDRVHIHTFPEIAEEMQGGVSPRIMILGNSLLLHGVDQTLLQENISTALSRPCSVFKITPVATATRDWHYLYDTYFTQSENHPDIVVIGFVGHHLPDQYELKIRRLTRHFCSLENLGSCLSDEGRSLDERAIGFLSHFSALFGDQRTHQWHVSSATIPQFGPGVSRLNNILDAAQIRPAANRRDDPSTPAPPTRSYRKLTHLIKTLKKHGVDPYFVPMPQPEPWTVDPAARATIEEHGATLIDRAVSPRMQERDFSDGYHLGETGKTRFTSFLASVLSEELSSMEKPAP